MTNTHGRLYTTFRGDLKIKGLGNGKISQKCVNLGNNIPINPISGLATFSQ